MLSGYVNEKLDEVELVGYGKGGVNELKKYLRDDSVFYGMVRVEGIKN